MTSKKDKEIKDTPLTLTTIKAFRQMLDVMEEFIRNSQKEQRENNKPVVEQSVPPPLKKCRW